MRASTGPTQPRAGPAVLAGPASLLRAADHGCFAFHGALRADRDSKEVTTAAGFLSGYSGRTREAYTLDLRQFVRWFSDHRLRCLCLNGTPVRPYGTTTACGDPSPKELSRDRFSLRAYIPRANTMTRPARKGSHSAASTVVGRSVAYVAASVRSPASAESNPRCKERSVDPSRQRRVVLHSAHGADSYWSLTRSPEVVSRAGSGSDLWPRRHGRGTEAFAAEAPGEAFAATKSCCSSWSPSSSGRRRPSTTARLAENTACVALRVI